MDNPDNKRRSDRRHESAPVQIVSPPLPHAGIGSALRHSFDPPPAMPDDWSRLLNRLR